MSNLGSHRLGDGESPFAESSPLPQPLPSPPGVDYNLVFILVSFLCVVVGILGLAFARCCWIRRVDAGTAAANRGLRKKVLEALPKFTFGDGDHEKTEKLSDCAICLTEFVTGDEIRVLTMCDHGFHVECIDTWLGSHSSCPSCRQIPVAATCKKCAPGEDDSSWWRR